MTVYTEIAIRLITDYQLEFRYLEKALGVTTREELIFFIEILSNELDTEAHERLTEAAQSFLDIPEMLETKNIDLEEMFSTAEIYSSDGNTVRRHNAQSREMRLSEVPEKFNLEFWTDDNLSPEEEAELHDAIASFVNGSFKIERIDLPIRRSFFQIFRLSGFRRYIKDVAANLKTAFSTVATNQNAEAIKKLSDIIAKHNNIIIRIDDIVAIKFTKNKQTHVLIEKMPPFISEAVNRNPHLLRSPQELYNLFNNIDNVVAFKRPLKKIPKNEEVQPKIESNPEPGNEAQDSA